MYNMWVSARRGVQAPADPWGGATLEWTIPSPPQEWNFTDEPTVAERDPVWGMKRAAGVRTLPEPTRSSGQGIHLPGAVVVAAGRLGRHPDLLRRLHGQAQLGVPVRADHHRRLPASPPVGIFKWAYEAA